MRMRVRVRVRQVGYREPSTEAPRATGGDLRLDPRRVAGDAHLVRLRVRARVGSRVKARNRFAGSGLGLG